MPRPAGRRWARLRRGGSRATKMIARVTRGRGSIDTRSGETVHVGTQVVFPRPDRSWRRLRTRRPGTATTVAKATIEETWTPPGWLPPDDLAALLPAASRGEPDERLTPVTIALLPGARTPIRRLKFAVANGCTLASLALGLTAVFFAIDRDFRFAALALLACVALDGCDGGLARRFGVSSPFGAQMDSLADLSSFGVAAAVVVYEWLLADGTSPLLAGPACALVAVCAAVRLARFNVSPKDGQFFCGVPTTMVAAVLALDILIGPRLPAGVQVLAIMVYALAMVTSFPYAKLVRVMRLPLWAWVFPAICAMISVPGTFAAIVGGYLLSGPLVWLYRSRQHLSPA